MDIATSLGLLAGALVLVEMAGGMAGLHEGAVLLLVLAGGFAATLVSYPLARSVNLLTIVGKVFFRKTFSPTDLISSIVTLAETARREGILDLENAIEKTDDPFLIRGVRLAVDGTEPDLIMDILETELQFIETRHRDARQTMGTLGRNWALFGILGAFIVLAQAGTESSGIELVAQASLPLLYGGVLAGLVGLPFERKLEAYSQMEILLKRMIIEGIMAIQSGDNPRIVEYKLSVFIAPKYRPNGGKSGTHESRRAEEETLPHPQPSPATQQDEVETPPLPESSPATQQGEEEAPSHPEPSPATGQAEEETPSHPEPSPATGQPVRTATAAPPPKAGEEEAKLEIEQVDLMLRLVREALERHAVDADRMALIDQMIAKVVQEKLVLFSLFSLLGEEVRDEVLVELEKEAPQLVERIRAQGGWFSFEEIARLTDREIQTLMREVDQKDMVMALKQTSNELREKFLGNMSERVRTFIVEEMDRMGPVDPGEILEVQGRILMQVIQLQLQQQISSFRPE